MLSVWAQLVNLAGSKLEKHKVKKSPKPGFAGQYMVLLGETTTILTGIAWTMSLSEQVPVTVKVSEFQWIEYLLSYSGHESLNAAIGVCSTKNDNVVGVASEESLASPPPPRFPTFQCQHLF